VWFLDFSFLWPRCMVVFQNGDGVSFCRKLEFRSIRLTPSQKQRETQDVVCYETSIDSRIRPISWDKIYHRWPSMTLNSNYAPNCTLLSANFTFRRATCMGISEHWLSVSVARTYNVQPKNSSSFWRYAGCIHFLITDILVQCISYFGQ